MVITLTKVSAKGQVVIPKDMRERMKLKEGDTLLLYSTDNILVLRKVRKQETVLSVIAEPVRKRIKRLGITRKDLAEAIKQER